MTLKESIRELLVQRSKKYLDVATNPARYYYEIKLDMNQLNQLAEDLFMIFRLSKGELNGE